MIYRSKAPLRIGLAGGGTDVSPYCDRYGGAILNATISLHAHAHIEQIPEKEIIFVAADRNETETWPIRERLPLTGTLDLHKGVYNRILQDHGIPDSGLRITSYVDVPAGSGLGTSSTLVVALIGAFREMLSLPLGEYDIAQYAYSIERNDLGLAGGRQDQYAATFGDFNFMEFFGSEKMIINPLRIKTEYLHEVENNLLLYYTDLSRESASIIREQQQNVEDNYHIAIEAMHQLKEQSLMMKDALLRGQLDRIGDILDFGFRCKRKMAREISNDAIEEIYESALASGASGGKISGAGGGGFMIFYCPGTSRHAVSTALCKFGGQIKDYSFTKYGLTTWTS